MKRLVQERNKAIELRQKGFTYKEILNIVPVAKSSLSLWLKDLPLTSNEKKSLKKRRDKQIAHGRIKVAGIMRSLRLDREREQLSVAYDIFIKHSKDPLFHTGIALYWAEGGKRTNQWQFMNSDDDMHLVMIKWLVKYINIQEKDLKFRLYIHKIYKTEDPIKWWSSKLQVSDSQFQNIVIKPSNLGVKKRPNYHGCLRLEVRSSKALLNMMKFWQKMIIEFYNG